MKKGLLFLALAALVCLTMQPLTATAAEEIPVGGIFDITGATSKVGADYAKGVRAACDYVNSLGGVNGRMINLESADYAYAIPKALNLYKKYVNVNKVFVIQGWGTGDTNALTPKLKKDEVIFMSASYDANLTNPANNPYNFFIGTDYSTSIRLAMQFAKDNGAKKVLFCYPDHPYGRAPIAAGKEYAQMLGLEIGPDEMVDLTATDATQQLLRMKKFAPDYVWLGGTTPSCAVVIKGAASILPEAKFLINCWGFDSNLPLLAQGAAEGRSFGILPVAPYGADVPGMKEMMAWTKGEPHTLHFVKGWVSVLVMAEGLKRAGDKLSGPGLKDALETLTDFETGGLCAPITYTSTDHRPNTTCGIGAIKDGKVVVLVGKVSMPREAKYIGK